MNTVLILIIGIPLIEIYLFIKIGSQIGAFNTVLLILTSAVIGVAYARYEGFNTLKESYIDLIRQQSKLMRIGDKTQLRLREAQTKINRELRIASEYVRSLLPE